MKILYKYNNINNNKIFNKLHNVVDSKHNVAFKVNNSNIKYLKKVKELFKTSFPYKNNYIKSKLPKNFNISLLISKIKESPFLMYREFATLEWCIKHYEEIINDFYKEYKRNSENQPQNTPEPIRFPEQDFSQRTYTREELNSLFDTLDDIEI